MPVESRVLLPFILRIGPTSSKYTNTSLEGGSPPTPSVRAENPVVNWLNAASTVVMALAIVATLLVSYATYHVQQDEHSAGIKAATQAAKIAFASKVVFGWDREPKRKAVIVNVQNANPLPVDAWVVYTPNLHPAAQPTRLTALSKPAGGTGEVVSDFSGTLPAIHRTLRPGLTARRLPFVDNEPAGSQRRRCALDPWRKSSPPGDTSGHVGTHSPARRLGHPSRPQGTQRPRLGLHPPRTPPPHHRDPDQPAPSTLPTPGRRPQRRPGRSHSAVVH
jgi:hypothetical protein